MEESNKLSYSESLWDGFYGITSFYSKQKEWMKGIYNGWKSEGEQLEKLGKYYKSSIKEKKGSENYGPLFNQIEDQLQKYHSTVGDKFSSLGTYVEKDLYTELHDIKMQVSDIIKVNTINEKRLEKDLKNAQTQAASAQKTDASQCQALVKLAESRRGMDDSTLPPKKIEKLNKQLLAAKENASRARSEYEKKIELLHKTHKNHEDEIKGMLDSMQKFDEDRLSKSKQIVLKYTSRHIELLKDLLQQAEEVQNYIQNLDPNDSIQNYIQTNKSKGNRSAPDTFQPYFPDANQIDEIVGKAMTSSEQTPNSNSETSTSTFSKDTARALYDYSPESEEEIEILCDDILEIHERREDGWWSGKNIRTGKIGLFPQNYVEEISQPTIAKKEDSGKIVAVALYDYETSESGELPFKEGEYLTVHEVFDDGWCLAESKSGQKGLAPQNYLQM